MSTFNPSNNSLSLLLDQSVASFSTLQQTLPYVKQNTLTPICYIYNKTDALNALLPWFRHCLVQSTLPKHKVKIYMCKATSLLGSRNTPEWLRVQRLLLEHTGGRFYITLSVSYMDDLPRLTSIYQCTLLYP